MIENKLSFFFKHQIWHIGGLIVLFYAGLQMVDFETNSLEWHRINNYCK